MVNITRSRHNCCYQDQENGESHITHHLEGMLMFHIKPPIVVSTHFKHNLSLPGTTSIIPGIQLHVPPDPKCRSLLYVANLVLPNMDDIMFYRTPNSKGAILPWSSRCQNKQWKYTRMTRMMWQAASKILRSGRRSRCFWYAYTSSVSLFVYAHPCTTFPNILAPGAPIKGCGETREYNTVAHGIGF